MKSSADRVIHLAVRTSVDSVAHLVGASPAQWIVYRAVLVEVSSAVDSAIGEDVYLGAKRQLEVLEKFEHGA